MTDWLINRWHVVIGSSVLNQAFTKANIASTWQVYSCYFSLYVSFLVSFDEVSWIPYHSRSVSTARTERDRHKTVGIARKTTARHAHPGIFSLPDYDVKLVMQSYMDNVKTRGRICLPVFQQIWYSALELSSREIGLHLINLTRLKRP